MSPIALSGLSSGLDTESIITQLMSVEQAPRDRMALQDTQAQARQTQLKDIQTRLTSLKNAADDLRSTTTWSNAQTVSSSDSARISVTTTGSAAPGAHLFEVSQLASSSQHVFDYTSSASAQSIQIGSFSLAVDPDSTIGTVAGAINASTDSPVSAVVAAGKLVLTSRATGASSDFTVTPSPLMAENAVYARAGVDANYKIDGISQTSSSNVLNDAILGTKITFNATTTAPVGVTVGNPGVDVAGVKSKATAFVNAYNNIVDLVRDKLSEKPIAGATSGTDATTGLFYGDTMLSGMLASMRQQVGDLSGLGISTGAASGTSKPSDDAIAGRLSLDSAALTTALTADPASVQTKLQGLATRMTATISPSSGSPVDVRLTSEDATRKRLADSMASMDTRLALKETRLRAQFSAMETALAAAKAQQSQMAAQLGSLG